jgi:hypothetical protein
MTNSTYTIPCDKEYDPIIMTIEGVKYELTKVNNYFLGLGT